MRRSFRQIRHRMIKKHASVPITEAKKKVVVSEEKKSEEPVVNIDTPKAKKAAYKKEVVDVDLQDE